MSVDIPVFSYKTRTADENDIYSYGFAFTSSDLDDAVKSLADILPDMLKLAETEKACQLMAAEIEKTRRRVNALEHVIIPQAQANIKYIDVYKRQHLYMGLFVKAYMCIRDGRVWDAICDVGFWLLLLTGLVFILMPTEIFASISPVSYTHLLCKAGSDCG